LEVRLVTIQICGHSFAIPPCIYLNSEPLGERKRRGTCLNLSQFNYPGAHRWLEFCAGSVSQFRGGGDCSIAHQTGEEVSPLKQVKQTKHVKLGQLKSCPTNQTRPACIVQTWLGLYMVYF